jgi:hypothetical protein
MKVMTRTLPALAMGAAGLVMMPALGAVAGAAPTARAVHLVTLIRALSRTPTAVQYAVTVRPVGGPAHAATLVLSTRRPASWTGLAPACLASRDRTALACDLGDLRESEARTLRVTARPGDRGPAEVPVIARAAAANAPSVTSSLGAAMRSQALRLARPADEPSPGSASPDQEDDAAAQSPEAQSSPGESPPAASPSAEAQAAPSEPAESEAATSPEIMSPAIRSRSAHPQGPAPAAPPRPVRPARPPAPPHKAPAVAGAVPEPGRLPVVPHAPIIPHVPDVPADAGAPPAGGPIGGPAVPLPVVSAPAALPQIAPQIAPKTSPGEGVSELNTLSPAGAMQAGRTSWATLVAVAVVAEAGLLWLVAGLTVWRRRRVGGGAQRSLMRPRGRSSRPLAGRLLP